MSNNTDSLTIAVELPLVPTLIFHHQDHLGGTAVDTDESGNIIELLDYYPYGSTRIHEVQESSYSNLYRYTGHAFDTETMYTYAGARYLNTDIGRWLSHDPVSLAIGSPALEQKAGRTLEQYLSDPQGMQSYGYARNNPIRYTDPTGMIPMGGAASSLLKSFTRTVRNIRSWIGSLGSVTYTKQPSASRPVAQTLNSPVEGAPITSLFMENRNGCSVCTKIHEGTDYGVPVGTPVRATADGTVVRSSWSDSLGEVVILDHGTSSIEGEQVYTLYGHGSGRYVDVGDDVNLGQVIMGSGDTGWSTGPHVHYEVISSPYDVLSRDFYSRDKYSHRYSPEYLNKLLLQSTRR